MKHRILLLHDVCTVGRAAAMNMIPVLNTMGVETCLLPTVMLSTHTGGFGKPAIQYVSPEYIKNCGEHCAEQNITFDAMKFLIRETEHKAENLSPIKGQTGPAVRNDINVMNKHIALLGDTPEAQLYQLISNHIQQYHSQQ